MTHVKAKTLARELICNINIIYVHTLYVILAFE